MTVCNAFFRPEKFIGYIGWIADMRGAQFAAAVKLLDQYSGSPVSRQAQPTV